MAAKSEQLQIRLSREQKTRLKDVARRAGLDVSAYVIAQALPDSSERFQRIVGSLRVEADRRYVWAELSDFLVPLGAGELAIAVSQPGRAELSAFLQNYLAATVEHLCARRGIRPPPWTSAIEPMSEPWFATELRSLRVHLIRSAPVAFRRRNLFVDAAPDARV